MDLTAVWRVVPAGVHLEDEFDLLVEFLGRRGLDRENSWTLEMSGKWLGYQIQYDNTAVFLRLREMDGSEDWQPILSVLDTPKSWAVIYDVIPTLEQQQLAGLFAAVIADDNNLNLADHRRTSRSWANPRN
jgi:hypothetical protein